MDKRTRRQIEWAFYNYEANKAIGAEQVRNIAEEGLTAQLDRISFGGNVGSPTESKALKICERAKQYLWAKVVENTLAAFRFEPIYEILQDRFFCKKSHKQVIIDNGYSERERTYYYQLDKAMAYAEMWVYEFGLMKF